MRRLFVLVPALIATGPVKGAVALANEAAQSREVTLVALKPGRSTKLAVDSRVQIQTLADKKTFCEKVRTYRRLLEEAGGRERVASISFCFSGDAVNSFCRSQAAICSSVRGNLFSNYRMDHGAVGIVAALVHMLGLRRFDRVVAMSEAMAGQINFFLGESPPIVGNFVDERLLETFRTVGERSGPLRFVFVASLSRRKQPLLLIRAIAALKAQGHDVYLDMIGKGNLHADCLNEVERLALQKNVTIHGHQPNPYPLLAQADAFVLPSLSEGISRAALEALFLGVPCILRAVDGNAELLNQESQGALFRHDADLAPTMLSVARAARTKKTVRPILLSDAFRQATATSLYLQLMDDI